MGSLTFALFVRSIKYQDVELTWINRVFQLYCHQNPSIATFLSTGDHDHSKDTESCTISYAGSEKMVPSNLCHFHESHEKSRQNDLNKGDVIYPEGPDSTSLEVENNLNE